MLSPASANRCRSLIAIAAAGLAALQTACVAPRHATVPSRYDRGLVLVLPGIEGTSIWSRSIVNGLVDGRIASAVELFDWTVRLPGAILVNLTDYERNLRQAQSVAERIVRYRDEFPGKPVHIVGHSGGGGIAILALEALPPGRQIDCVILLAPALSPNYDLTTALRRSRRIYSFYSQRDVSFLKLGTALFGAIDRAYGPSAGAVGFSDPKDMTPELRQLRKSRLRQVSWNPILAEAGASGTHLGWASRDFVRDYLAPHIREAEAERYAQPVPTE